MKILEELRKVIKEYEEAMEKSKDLHGTEAVENYARINALLDKRTYICSLIAERVNPLEADRKIYDRFDDNGKLDYKRRFLFTKRQMLLTYMNKHPEVKPLTDAFEPVSMSKDAPFYDELEKKYAALYETLPPEMKEAYDSATILTKAPLPFFSAYVDDIAGGLADMIDEKTAAELDTAIEAYVPLEERPPETISEPLFAENYAKMEEGATEEQKEALAYAKENFRRYESKFSDHIGSLQSHVMQEMSYVEGQVTDKYLETHEEYKDLFVQNGSMSEVPAGKETQFGVYREMEYALSDKTKDAMKTLMHRLDEMKLIDRDNVLVAEEGSPKMYAFLALQRAGNDVRDALENGRVDQLPELTKVYRDTKTQYDDMLKICRENFSDVPLLYSSNVDVARNASMPLEYRQDSHAVSMLSSLYIALKFCKFAGIGIDEFVERPNACLKQAYEKHYERLNPDAMKEKSLGNALFYLKKTTPVMMRANYARITGLLSRAEECMKAFEPDEEKLLHNTFLYHENRICSDAVSTYASSSTYLANDQNGTVFNMALFGKSKSVFELNNDPKWKYDAFHGKHYGKIDVEAYLRDNRPNCRDILANVKEMYEGCALKCLELGETVPEDLMQSLKAIPGKLKELRPDIVRDPVFKKVEKYVSYMAATPTAESVIRMSGENGAHLSDETKKLATAALKMEKARYEELPLSTRFFSYFPFVHNKATEYRYAYRDAKHILELNDVTKEQIDNFDLNSLNEAAVIAKGSYTADAVDVRPESEKIPLSEQIRVKIDAEEKDLNVDKEQVSEMQTKIEEPERETH